MNIGDGPDRCVPAWDEQNQEIALDQAKVERLWIGSTRDHKFSRRR